MQAVQSTAHASRATRTAVGELSSFPRPCAGDHGVQQGQQWRQQRWQHSDSSGGGISSGGNGISGGGSGEPSGGGVQLSGGKQSLWCVCRRSFGTCCAL